MNRTHAQLLEVPLEELALLKAKSIRIRSMLSDRSDRFESACNAQLEVIAAMLRNIESITDQVEIEMLKVEGY